MTNVSVDSEAIWKKMKRSEDWPFQIKIEQIKTKIKQLKDVQTQRFCRKSGGYFNLLLREYYQINNNPPLNILLRQLMKSCDQH